MDAALQNDLTPERAKEVLRRHLLTEGMMPLMLDMDSRGVKLRDEVTGRTLLDFFGFYASSAVGMNHPKLTEDTEFRERLMEAALNKITNSDVRTRHLARFVETFSRVAIPEVLPHAFFISGGALAIENALKAAFDWKVRKNFEKGYRREVGSKVLHLEEAFHGRTGYTMSLTNTVPRKTKYFPKFDWPRITNPKVKFPLEEYESEVAKREELAIKQARRHFQEQGDEIAAIILEPIQGEGGDNHFRPAFLQQLRDLADEEEALLIFDEVQSGVGITGDFWAYQALGVRPDILAFGKKTQVCGILASRRLDEVDGHVFETTSRINSTWGGNLVDMVRFGRILEVIEEDDLVSQAGRVGAHLLEQLRAMEDEHEAVLQTRGRGLMCAFDLPSATYRDRVLEACYEEGVILLGCGERTIRFRSPLTITEAQIDEGLSMMERAIGHVQRELG